MDENFSEEISSGSEFLNSSLNASEEYDSVLEQNKTLTAFLLFNSSDPLDYRDQKLAYVEIFVLSLILAIAIIGNGLMILAFKRQLRFRPMSRMYSFMLNLSLADLLVAFGNILPQLAWDITYRFKGTDLLCRFVKFLQSFVLYLSTYILTSMAIDRYLVVCHQSFSRQHYWGLRGPKFMIGASWILSIIFATPQTIIFSLTEIKPGIIDCWTFMTSIQSKLYVTWFVLSVFLLPLVIVGLSYGAICIKVLGFTLPGEKNHLNAQQQNKEDGNGICHYSKQKHTFSGSSGKASLVSDHQENAQIYLRKKGESSSSTALRRQITEAKAKTLKLTLVVVLCFFICWAPFCITQLIMVYNPDVAIGPLHVILLLLASLNSCTNPWIYIAFSESLRNQLRVCLGIGPKRGSSEESIGDEQIPRAIPQQQISKKKIPKARLHVGASGVVLQHQFENEVQLQEMKHQAKEDHQIVQPETKSELLSNHPSSKPKHPFVRDEENC